MCQPKSAGGRRCAAHLAATRASRQIAMAGSGLAVEQVNTAFNALRAEGRDRPEPTTKQYVQFLQRQLNNINESRLDHTQRERVRGMIRTATEENMPDGSTFYALKNLNSRVRRQSVALRNEITRLAPQMGITRSEAMSQFWHHYQAPASGMNSETPAGYADADQVVAAQGTPTDAATARALRSLQDSASNPQSNPNIAPEPRINRRAVENSFVKEIGYDHEDGRLEVVLHATPGVVHSYRNVPESTWRQMTAAGASVGSVYAYNVRHNPDFEYISATEAQSDGHARRCTYCGQFRAVSHSCPQSRGQIRQPRVAQPALSTPAVEEDNNQSIAEDVTLVEASEIEEATPEVDELQQAYARPLEERGEVQDLTELPESDFNIPESELGDEESVEDRAFIGGGSAYFRGMESMATLINNGDAVRVTGDLYISSFYHTGRRIPSFDANVTLEVYRDENGWQANATGTHCYSCSADVCDHTAEIERGIPNIVAQLRRTTDPDQQTPTRRVERLVLAPMNRRTNEPGQLLTVPQEETVDEATGFPHRLYESTHNSDRLDTGDVSFVRSALESGSVIVPVHWSGYRASRDLPEDMNEFHGGFSVRGDVTLARGEDGVVRNAGQNLRCNCEVYRNNYRCAHTDYVSNQMPRIAQTDDVHAEIGRLNSTAEVLAEQQRQSNWANNPEYAAAMMARHPEVAPEDSYSRTFASFQSDLAQAQEKIDAGQSPLTYLTENATGGICAPETGRKFGVELEFDFAEGMNSMEQMEAREKIGRELHAAGLTSTPDQQSYHAGASNGWAKWSFENDCTVSGEVVSPVMTDTPENWQQLQQVCEIIKRNGGIATARTGSHVHVSTGSLGSSVEKHAELAYIVNQHEDTIYRLATNPESGTHRPMQWCAPNTGLNARTHQEASAGRMYSFGSGHNLGINFDAATGSNVNRDNVEFRQWDGTLDPAVIQNQVLLSAAMVDAAERNVDAHGLSQLVREPVGSHDKRRRDLLDGSRRKLTEQEQAEDTASTRSFFDAIFSNREHKQRATALFAMTKWQKRT